MLELIGTVLIVALAIKLAIALPWWACAVLVLAIALICVCEPWADTGPAAHERAEPGQPALTEAQVAARRRMGARAVNELKARLAVRS